VLALIGGAALGLVALTGVAVRSFTRTPAAVITRYAVEGAGAAAVNLDLVPELAVLSNGAIVYAGVGSQGSAQLFLRTRDQIEPTLLPTSGNARGPFASPDGQRIGFIDVVSADPAIKTVPTTGGPAIRVSSFDKYPVVGATWGDDNTIVFATMNPSTGLYRVPATGGQPEVLTKPDAAHAEGDHVWPQFLPQARAMLFTIIPPVDSEQPSQIAVLELRNGRKKVLNLPGAESVYPHPSIRQTAYLQHVAECATGLGVTATEVDTNLNFGAKKALDALDRLEWDIYTKRRFCAEGEQVDGVIHALRITELNMIRMAQKAAAEEALSFQLNTLLTNTYGEFILM
jgi:hypothetical protein